MSAHALRRDGKLEKHKAAAIRPAAVVPGGPAVTVYTESLSVDDVTQSKLEFGQSGMRFVGLGQEATFSSLSSHCFFSSTQPSTGGQSPGVLP